MSGKNRPCLACNEAIPSPLDVCLRCEHGAALYAVPGGQWAVEIGPITSTKFRTAAVEYLSEALDGVNRAEALKAITGGRVRVVQHLSKRSAEALVKRLGTRETSARAVEGEAEKAGIAGALRGGTPLLALAVGGLLIWPVGLNVVAGLLVGVGGALALGALNMKRTMPVLGRADFQPTLPYQIAEAPEQLVSLLPKLPAEAQEHVRTVGEVGFRILGRVTDPEDVMSVGADGLDGGMGSGALGLIQEAVRIAGLIVRDGPGDHNAPRLETLQRLSTTAREAMGALDALEQSVSLAPSNAAEIVAKETELVQAAVTELKQVV